jgi:hypothetical protein
MQVFAHLTGSSDETRKKAGEAITAWEVSERNLLACFMATAGKLHREAVLRHQKAGSPMYDLYVEICNHHQQGDASQRHEAWIQFTGIRKSATETYMSYYRRIEAAYDKIDRITPANQTAEERAKELKLFGLINGLLHEVPLRMSLTALGSLLLADAVAALLRVDTGKKLAESEAEQAHAAQGASCWTCNEN